MLLRSKLSGRTVTAKNHLPYFNAIYGYQLLLAQDDDEGLFLNHLDAQIYEFV